MSEIEDYLVASKKLIEKTEWLSIDDNQLPALDDGEHSFQYTKELLRWVLSRPATDNTEKARFCLYVLGVLRITDSVPEVNLWFQASLAFEEEYERRQQAIHGDPANEPIQILLDLLTKRFPDIPMGLDPLDLNYEDGIRHLDIACDLGKSLIIRWEPIQGFGIYRDNLETSEDPDEIHPDVVSIFKRIEDLIISWGP